MRSRSQVQTAWRREKRQRGEDWITASMEAPEGEGGGGAGGGNSSDSGSGGIIDVSTVSSNFGGAPTPQANGGCMNGGEERDRNSAKKACPHSVEKVWFTDTTTGVWLLEDEESAGCDIPEEFLDVSLESEEEEEEKDGDGEGLSDEESHPKDSDKPDDDSSDTGKDSKIQPQMCGWVPLHCCLIPLPESPTAASGGNGGSDEKAESEEERGGRELCGAGPLSESELRRQQEEELEVLFGYKPPLNTNDGHTFTCKSSEKAADEDAVQEDVVESEKVEAAVRNVGKPRSNSTDSGVASISPRSSEGDVEHRPSRNQMAGVLTAVEVQGDVAGTSPKTGSCVDEELKGGSTPEEASQKPRLPVSRLRTPSEKCSILSSSPVVCSELEDLKEASKITNFPPITALSTANSLTSAHDKSDRCHQTFTVIPTVTSPTPQSSSSTSSHSEKSSGSQSASNSSAASSAAGSESTNTKKIEKKAKSSSRLNKPACRGTIAYKAGTGAPPVKVVKRPPLKLKSLLPASTVSSVLPSQLKKPPETKSNKSKAVRAEVSTQTLTSGTQPRKNSAPVIARPSGLVQPVKKATRRSLGNLAAPTLAKAFAKPANPNPIKEAKTRPTSTANPTRGVITTPTRKGGVTTPTRRGGARSRSNPSTPTRVCANVKQQHTSDAGSKQPTVPTATSVVPLVSEAKQGATGKETDLSVSIVTSCSPSVQQSTPVSAAAVSTAQQGTVTRVHNRTVTKESSATGRTQNCEGNPAIPITPKSSIASTPSRRVRPKFSLSSIDSESGPVCPPPPAQLGNSYTEGASQPAVESTPISSKKKRRSFIPTPVRQPQESAEVPHLVYNSDNKSTARQTSSNSPPSKGPPANKPDSDAVVASSVAGTKRKSLMPNPRPRKPLVSRNRVAVGVGRRQQQPQQKDGPLKPLNAYKYCSKAFGENSEPPIPSTKVVHSPVNKDDQPESPHSAWSPIRRKPVAESEACFQCTKRGYRN